MKRRLTHFISAALLLTGLIACSSAPLRPVQYLDEATAATITVAARALVFACERPDLAVNARDYLTLAPVDVNRAGRHSTYLYGYLWSTIDRRPSATLQPGLKLVVMADDRIIELKLLAGDAHDIGIGQAPLAAPAKQAHVVVGSTDLDALQYLTLADQLRAVATGGGDEQLFILWKDERGAVAQFVGEVGPNSRMQ